jgi:hypothetical protein
MFLLYHFFNQIDIFIHRINSNQLEEKEQVLARWLSEHFAFNYTNDLMLIIAAHKMHLNPQFWSILGREVALETTDSIENTVIARWISFLLSPVPPIIDDDILLWLGQLCIERGMISSLVQIFDNLSESRLQITEGILWPDMEEDQRNRVDVDLHLIGERDALNELWQNGLKPSLAQIADYLLDIVVKHLEKQHFILRTWQKATPEWDYISMGRAAIEPHEQDQYPKSVDVLIDAARDCLEWLALNQKQLAAQWCDRQIGSEIPLLRRLAVHTLSARTDLSNEGKLGWLLTHIDLHQISIHHEIFQAVKLCYPMASQNHRVEFIEAVLAYQSPDDNMDHEKQTEWSHFQWLHWIHNAAPDCPLAKKALTDIQMRNPDLRPREYPDLTHSVSVEWGGLQSPWTAEELLVKPASKWLQKLLSFESVGLRGPNREGLAITIAEVTKRQPGWGLGLAKALAEIKEWSSDIWPALIRAWGETNLTEHEYCEILGWLNKVDLYKIHNRVIVNVLHMFVENDGKPYVINFLSETNKIALVLWTYIEPQEQLGDNDDWLTRAINHPAGILTRYWIESLSIWRKQFDPRPDKLSDDYDRVLTTIVKGRSLLGRLGRSVLTSQFAFFLGADEVWTRENLIPLFDFDNGVDDFNAAWDGFLTWGHLSPNVAHLLEGLVLKAIQRIENLHERDRFIEFYTAMILYHVSEPLPVWIPELFRYANRNLWCLFALKVNKYLQEMNEIHQKDCWKRWLKLYWENRIQGVPAKLENDEIARMIEWLPSLQFVFDEAVDLAINMPPAKLQRCSVTYYLSKSNLLELHPESVGKLLIYLGKCESPRFNWHKAREIIEKLSHIGIPSVLEKELQELLVTLDL